MNRSRNLMKAALCSAYLHTGAAWVQEQISRRTGREFMPILLFHRVTDVIPEDGLTVSTARFRAICRMLRDRFRVVPLGEVFDVLRTGRAMPPRTVAITFDDGYRDNLFAARVLADFGLPAVFFVPTAFVGTERVFAWDRGLAPMANASWTDLREMIGLGHEIGSHTVTHANLGKVSSEQAQWELIESKAHLEAQLGQRVRWFAYPFGGRNDIQPNTAALIKAAGYDGCLSGYGGFVQPDSDHLILPRDPAPCYQGLVNLELHLRGCLDWFYALKRRTSAVTTPAERLSEWMVARQSSDADQHTAQASASI